MNETYFNKRVEIQLKKLGSVQIDIEKEKKIVRLIHICLIILITITASIFIILSKEPFTIVMIYYLAIITIVLLGIYNVLQRQRLDKLDESSNKMINELLVLTKK